MNSINENQIPRRMRNIDVSGGDFEAPPHNRIVSIRADGAGTLDLTNYFDEDLSIQVSDRETVVGIFNSVKSTSTATGISVYQNA